MPARRLDPADEADIRLWEKRLLAAPDYSMSLPVFVGDACLVTREIDGRPVIVRLPADGNPDGATVLVDPQDYARPGEELTLQKWGKLSDNLIFFGLTDAREDGIVRFLDPVTGRTVGREIHGYRNDSVVLCEVGGTPVLYYGVHPMPGTPGKAEWWVRVGGLDGEDLRLDIPAPPADPPMVPRPDFSVHSHRGRQWLVALSASGAGEFNDLHVAELSAPGASPERPIFTQSTRTTIRTTSLGLKDGKATFVSTDLGRVPQGAVFRAPVSGLCDREQWTELITSDQPGAHINSVAWAGDGPDARLLVRRTYGGRDFLDVHDRRGARLFTVAGPPDDTSGLVGMTSRTVDGTTTAYLKWGSLTTAGVYTYELGEHDASVSVWEPWAKALEGHPARETVTYTWLADYGGTKAAVGELTRLAGTGRNPPPLGTLIVFYSSFGTPQSTPSLYGGPQRWADAWVRAGGQVLSILTQDPVDAATRHREADAVIAVLESGVVAGLLEGRTNVLTGFSAAAVTVARVANRRPDLVRVAASLHGWLSNGSRAAAVGVGPNTMLPHGLGFPTDGPDGGPVERLAASTRSPSKNLGVYLATGTSDTRVDPGLHAGALVRLLRERGLEPLMIAFDDVGHASGMSTHGVMRQWPTHLAVFARHLAGVRRPGRGTPVAQTAADVVRRRVPEETTVEPSREVRATMAGYADTTPAQLTGRLRKVGVRTHRSGGAAARPGRTGGAGSGRVRERAPGASGV